MTSTAATSGRATMPTLPPWALGVIGVASVIAGWWIAAATFLRGVGRAPGAATGAIPTPGAIVEQMIADGFGFFWRNASVTITEAGIGYLWGVGLAFVLAGLVLLAPRLETLITQLGVISYCLSIVAIGPIVYIVVGAPDTGQPSGTAIALAGLSVFFTSLVSALAGFRSADRAALEVIAVAGGRRLHQLVKVQLIAALPSLFTALKVAAPAAVLGAILGEYVGGVDRGLGPAMVNAQQSLEIARVWSVGVLSGLVAFVAYALLDLLGRPVDRWVLGERRPR